MSLYGLCGQIVARPGDGDALAALLLDAAAAMGAVAGCHLYVVSRDPGNEDAVWVLEAWESADAHQASLKLESVRNLISQARPIIASMGERIELQPVGGKGLVRS